MYCKYEGGKYISYDEVVRDGKLADVVDIRFEELEDEECLASLKKAQWAKMTSLKKMVIIDCGVPQYDFLGKSEFTNLEEVEVSMSIMNTKTALSLLTTASKITKFSTSHTAFSPINGPFRDTLDRKINEIESCAKLEIGSSNSSELSAHAVRSSSIGASSTLNRWLESPANTEDVDDESSISSFEVSRDEAQQYEALGGFVNRASDKLTKLNMSGCDISKGGESQAIAELKSKVNNRSQSVSENSNRRDNVGAGAGAGAGLGGYSQKSSTSRLEETRLNSGQSPLIRDSRQNSAHERRRNTRQSLDSSNSDDQSGNLGHNRFGRDEFSADFFSRDSHVGRFKTMTTGPEMVVENGAAGRDYAKLCEDTEGALDMIKAADTFGKEKYSSVKIGGEATGIVYKGTSNTTPILDAYIDKVKVHRGWREVDPNISDKARAKIIIKSLGIPPCPPGIVISNERSRLGQAIRREFNKLLRDDPDITVNIKPR
ncbi:MAG: hypothetical protein NTZ86_09210 [Legionellales bacterium]|nr:hypothetical protein [Legionellales bacterium]